MPTPTSARRGPFRKCQDAIYTTIGQGWVCTICPAISRSTGDQPFFRNFKAALNHERAVHGHELYALKNEGNPDDGDEIGIPKNRLQTADEIGHPRLTSEGLRQWEMHAHVDHVFDLVPFWQRGIDAAERGQVLRLEEFLDKMEGDGGWRSANEVLGMLGGWKVPPSQQPHDYGGPMWGQPDQDDWAASQRGALGSNAFGWEAASQGGGWGVGSTRATSDATEPSRRRDNGWGVREEWTGGGSNLKMGGGEKDSLDARVKTVGAMGDSGGREELHHFVDAIARQEAVNEERRRQMHLFFKMPVEQKIQKIQETIRFLRTHAA